MSKLPRLVVNGSRPIRKRYLCLKYTCLLLLPILYRDSWTSQDSAEAYVTGSYVPRRWPTLESAGRCLFLFSLAFFIVGVLVTVFGFSNGVGGLETADQRLPLKILGPACLFGDWLFLQCIAYTVSQKCTCHLQ